MDVLIGIDGSAEASQALRAAIRLIGNDIGRLTLASVITFDETTPQARRNDERAVALLEEAARSIGTHAPGWAVLTGQPAEALMNHATKHGYELLAIGRRGRGASKALLGSTATRAVNGPIPVLVV